MTTRLADTPYPDPSSETGFSATGCNGDRKSATRTRRAKR